MLERKAAINPPQACNMSKHLNMTVQRVVDGQVQTVPVFFFSRKDCTSTGNIIGMYYEALTFAMSHQMAMALIANHHCKQEQTLLSYLPTIIYPPAISNQFSWDTIDCSKLQIFPWEHVQNALFSGNLDMLFALNHEMITSYTLDNHFHKNIPFIMKDTLMIHFRCRDNFSSRMGLFPFSFYLSRVTEIVADFKSRNYEFASITILSDAMPGGFAGDTCWRLVGELRRLLSQHFPSSGGFVSQHRGGGPHHSAKGGTSSSREIIINDVYTTPFVAYAMLHYAKVVICSISTFCFFAVFDGKFEGRLDEKSREENREVHFVNQSTSSLLQVPSFFFEEGNMREKGWSKQWKAIVVKSVGFAGNRSDSAGWEKFWRRVVDTVHE